jgi:hypothetical protein
MFAQRAVAIRRVPQKRAQGATTWAEQQKELVDSVVRIKHANFPSQSSSDESDTLYDLWKYYSTKADDLKDKLWTTGTWLIALIGGLLALLFNTEVVKFRNDFFQIVHVPSPCVAILISCIGVLISFYSSYVVIRDFQDHVIQNWWRAKYVLKRCAEKPARDSFKAATVLQSIVLGLLGAHLYILVAAISALGPLENAARTVMMDSGVAAHAVQTLPAASE